MDESQKYKVCCGQRHSVDAVIKVLWMMAWERDTFLLVFATGWLPNFLYRLFD